MMLLAWGIAEGQYHFTWTEITTEQPLNHSDLNVLLLGLENITVIQIWNIISPQNSK